MFFIILRKQKYFMKKIFISLVIIPVIILAQENKSKDLHLIKMLQIDSTITNVIVLNDKFIAYSKNYITCFDRENNLSWKNQLIDTLISNVIYVDNRLVLVNDKYELILINIDNGKIIQSLGLDVYSKVFLSSFDFSDPDKFLLSDDYDFRKALLLIFESGTILSLDLETLQEYWRKSYNEFFISQPKFIDNKFLISTKSGFINYVDLTNGLLLWKWKETKDFNFDVNSLLINDKYVYLINNGNNLYSVNLVLGKLNWKIDKAKFFKLLFTSNDKKFLYAQNEKNNIVQISLSDGQIKKEIKSNLLKNKVSYVFIYKGQYHFVVDDKLFKFFESKIRQVLKNEFSFKDLIFFNDDEVILSDIKNNLLIIN